MITKNKKFIIVVAVAIAAIIGVILWFDYNKKVERLNAESKEMAERMNYPWRHQNLDTPTQYQNAVWQINNSNLSDQDKLKERQDVDRRYFNK